MNGGVLGSIAEATKHVSDGWSRMWPARQGTDSEASKAENFRNLLRVLEAVLFLGALFVLVRFVFAHLVN